MNDEWSNKFKKLNFTLSYTIIEFFSDIDYPKVLNIPLEFKINLIDERIDYYSQYDDEHYYDFVTEGLKIYEKYKFQCNKLNKLLIYYTNLCTFEKKDYKEVLNVEIMGFGILLNVFLHIVIMDIFLIK
jgi:hypothetical protein